MGIQGRLGTALVGGETSLQQSRELAHPFDDVRLAFAYPSRTMSLYLLSGGAGGAAGVEGAITSLVTGVGLYPTGLSPIGSPGMLRHSIE
jgi:hypothetical protein